MTQNYRQDSVQNSAINFELSTVNEKTNVDFNNVVDIAKNSYGA